LRNGNFSEPSGFPAQQSTRCWRHPPWTRALSSPGGISIDSAGGIREDFFLGYSLCWLSRLLGTVWCASEGLTRVEERGILEK